MKLNHIGLTVEDVAATMDFLETQFGLRRLGEPSTKMGHLQYDDGLILSLFRTGFLGATLSAPSETHIGFMQPDEAAVDAVHRRLTEAGLSPDRPRHAHGYTFTATAPGGIAVEVMC